mmetsp:Transcript_21096/g.32581  ORF Transcript_21096/g.32581 Transcript_21096/m.32581 type:complete len:145 (-) Transcript_21096:67-501(-)
MPMKTVLVGCPKIEISLLEDPPPLGVAPPMKAKPIIMRAAAAHLTGSLLWIFGELLERWVDWRGRGFGNRRSICREQIQLAQSNGIGARRQTARTTERQSFDNCCMRSPEGWKPTSFMMHCASWNHPIWDGREHYYSTLSYLPP